MKAIVRTLHGSPDVLEYKEVEKPSPNEKQLLIKVYAAGANALDYHLMRGLPYVGRIMDLVRKPTPGIIGVDFAGRVEAVGSEVTQFKPGDEVFGMGAGAFAEYICVRETSAVSKPTNITFEQAAAVPVGALTALQGLRDQGEIKAGQKVLIYGASGGVGIFAVQVAKVFGAEVTAVCSTKNMEMVRSLGADHVIDYKKEDITRSKQQFDLIMAVNGYHSIMAYRRILSPTGIYVMAGAAKSRILLAVFETMLMSKLISKVGQQKVRFYISKGNQKDFLFLRELLATGKITPVIDGCYPLSKAAEAIRYMETVHPRGKVVISVEHSNII